MDTFECIRGNCNPAHNGTKLNSPVVDAFLLTMATKIFQFDFQSLEVASRHHPHGSITMSKSRGGM